MPSGSRVGQGLFLFLTSTVRMNISCLLHTLLVNSSSLFPQLPPEIMKVLGHSVIVSPYALRVLPTVDFPYFLAAFGDVLSTEVTGAVIAGEAPEALREQIGFLRSQKGWMSKAVVVIVASKPNHSFFSYLWKREIMNVLWFTRSRLYTYNPFNDTIIALDETDIKNRMDARWKDLQGYKVPIALHIHNLSFRNASLGGGIDGSAVFELTKHWNMTVDLKLIKGDHITLHTKQMLLGGQAAIVMSAQVLYFMETEFDVEYSTSIYGDSCVVALKMPNRQSRCFHLSIMLTRNVWLAMILMNTPLICKNRVRLRASCTNKHHNPTRKRMCQYLLFRLVIVFIFQASLIYFLKTIGASDGNKTLSGVLKNHKNLLTNSWVVKRHFKSLENSFSKPGGVVVVDPLTDEWLDRNPVALHYKELQLMMEGGLLNKELYLINEELYSFTMFYVVKRGSPFLKYLSHFTTRSFESGLSEKWYRLTLDRVSEDEKKIYPAKVKEQKQSIIAIAFFILFLGELELVSSSVKMNVGALLRTFLTLNSIPPNQEPLPRDILHALGHTVLMTPPALDRMPSPDISHIVAEYGDIVEEVISGAVIAGEDGVLQEQVTLLNTQSGWMARAMVVVLTNSPSRNMFQYLWRKRMSNVICLSDTGAIHAYNPFNDTIFTVDRLVDIEDALDKRWKNLYGYKVRVTMYKYPLSYVADKGLVFGAGIDGTAAYELSRHYNLSIAIQDTGINDHRFENSNKMLSIGTTDASLNGRFLNRGVKYDTHLEYSRPIYADSVVVVLKIPPKLRGWDIFARIFKWSVWLVLLAVIFITNGVMMWINRQKNHWSFTLITTIRAIFNVPITTLPNSIYERFILGQSFIVGMVLLTVFQGSLFHFIKDGTTYAKYRSLSEVYKDRMLVTNTWIIRDFIPSNEHGLEKLRDSVKIIRRISDENFEKYALAIRQKEIELMVETGIIQENLYFVEEKIISFTMCYTLKRGSPFLKPLSRFTTHVFEGGLSEYWYKATIRKLTKKKKAIHESKPFKVLTIRDVEVAFLALGLGHTLSCIIFLMEVLSKLRKRKGFKRSIRKFLHCGN